MVLESEDSQALDVLSTPSSVHLHLVRCVTKGLGANVDSVVVPFKYVAEKNVAQAYFWAPQPDEGFPPGGRRELHGEIEVGRGLKPSFEFPKVALKVRHSWPRIWIPFV